MTAPGARTGLGSGNALASGRPAGIVRSIQSAALPLLKRLRRRGLENPLLPLPAVLAVAVGFFAPLAVLIVYSFWPTEGGQIVHRWTLDNYVRFFSSAAYPRMLLRSFW